MDPSVPTPVVVLRNLHPDTAQDKILYTLKAYGPVNDVRLIRDKVTGESRGFAFVEFPSVDDAQRFMEYHHNTRLDIDGRIVYMDYSKQKDSHHHHNSEYRDWICPQCTTTNFSRRAMCYTCQAPKPQNPVFVSQSTEDTTEPGPVLALRGLDPSSVEATIYGVLSEYAPIKEVRLVREKGTNISRGLCFVEFHSVEDATYVLHNCQKQALHIDGCPVRLGYARKNQSDRHHHNQQHQQQAGFANAALEQAQWAAAQTHIPDAAQQAQWNEIGFYYDAQSGYYYNATTGYSYHPTTQTYYSFDPATQALVAVAAEVALAALPLPTPATTTTIAEAGASGAGTDAGTTATQEAEKAAKKEKKRKAKTIRDKKMGQELERWMKKTQELKQDEQQSLTAASPAKITISFGATNKLLVAGDSSSNAASSMPEESRSARDEAVDTSPLPPAGSQFVVISSGNANPETTTASTASLPTSQPSAVAAAPAADLPQSRPVQATAAAAAPKTYFPPQSARPDVGLEFVCLVCRCKFARARTLDLHKLQSKRHKANVEEAHEAEVEQIREMTRVQQKAKGDQAHQHHGGGGGGKKQRQHRESATAASSTTATTAAMSAAAAGVALGEGIGGQMLKRMGWKQGEGLGKDATGQVNPVEVSRRSERAGLGAEDDVGDIELDPNDTYQDVAKKKARARLESMMHY